MPDGRLFSETKTVEYAQWESHHCLHIDLISLWIKHSSDRWMANQAFLRAE